MALKRYREVALARLSGEDEVLDVDMDVVFDERGRAYRRVKSKTNPMVWGDVAMDGSPVDYERKLLHEKRVISDYDRKRRLRAVPKPTAVTPSPVPQLAVVVQVDRCPLCGGYGYTTDEYGYDEVCECRNDHRDH